MKRIFTFFLSTVLLVGVSAQNSDLMISEYVEGWSNNKALEIYNPTPGVLDLSEYRLVRYSNGEDVPPPEDKWTVDLPAVDLGPYQTFVIVIDQRNPQGTGQTAPVWEQLQQRADVFLCPDYNISETMYFNGDDAVVIEKNEGGGTWSIQDIFGRWGPPAPALAPFVGSTKEDNAWTNVAPYVTGEGVAITGEHTMIRKSSVVNAVLNNPSLFNPLAEYDTLPANTFNHLGWHDFDNAPANETPQFGSSSYKFAVSPGAGNNTVIGNINATDAEGDPLNFYIDYNNFIYIDDVRYEPFALDKETGELTVADANGLAPEILDTFYLEVTVNDGYSQADPTTVMVIVTDEDIGTAVDYKKGSNLNLFPNPVLNNRFEIRDELAFNEVTVLNLLGQVVFQRNYDLPVNQDNIYIENTSKGIYMVNIKYPGGESRIQKLIFK
ncbi:MAG: lamin tail domain-containing protein [Bacteroidales bacterium]